MNSCIIASSNRRPTVWFVNVRLFVLMCRCAALRAALACSSVACGGAPDESQARTCILMMPPQPLVLFIPPQIAPNALALVPCPPMARHPVPTNPRLHPSPLLSMLSLHPHPYLCHLAPAQLSCAIISHVSASVTHCSFFSFSFFLFPPFPLLSSCLLHPFLSGSLPPTCFLGSALSFSLLVS